MKIYKKYANLKLNLNLQSFIHSHQNQTENRRYEQLMEILNMKRKKTVERKNLNNPLKIEIPFEKNQQHL